MIYSRIRYVVLTVKIALRVAFWYFALALVDFVLTLVCPAFEVLEIHVALYVPMDELDRSVVQNVHGRAAVDERSGYTS